MAEEYKHVEEDGDLSEDEFEVRPAVAGSALKLTKSHLEIPRDARGEADKDSEEAAARGGEIAIVFKHGGASVHARFPVGQDIGNVKAYFADAVNLQAANIVLTFAVSATQPVSAGCLGFRQTTRSSFPSLPASYLIGHCSDRS